MGKSTSSLKAAIIIKAFGTILRKHVNGDVKDLVMVVEVVVVVAVL
jgi:hypothetical protein